MSGPQNTPVSLKTRETMRIVDGEGLEVKCLRGSLWLTQDQDYEDRRLAGGQSFVLNRPGLSLVTALNGPALLRVQPAGVPQRLLPAA